MHAKGKRKQQQIQGMPKQKIIEKWKIGKKNEKKVLRN